jgi:hypothetical protein
MATVRSEQRITHMLSNLTWMLYHCDTQQQHAAGEEASMAEIAYELLLAHDNEDMSDRGRVEDFVDQCKVLTEIIAQRQQQEQQSSTQ